MPNPTDVFISYSSRDFSIAEPMCAALEAAGLSCWIAPRNITPGQTWSEAIMEGINHAEVLVLLFTAASNASTQVLREVERAVNRRMPLITFRVENIFPTGGMEYFISVSHWEEGHTGTPESHFPSLITSVRAAQEAHQSGMAVMPETRSAGTAPPPPLPPNNLPPETTSFIGREAQIREALDLLNDFRLVTLQGAGGVGKTRLARKVAEEAARGYPDGVWQVEMASLTDSELVPQSVAAALGVKEQPGRPIEALLLDYLQGRSVLLLLDNCEHLAAACARLCESILSRCPKVRILATSREKLNASGEKRYPVPPLSAPEPGQVVTEEALKEFEATRLFIERAAAALPTFAVRAETAPVVASICRRVDGIPLAIELAAARVRALPIEEIDARLDQRFRLLTGGNAAAPTRQQTLRAMIDWSYDLLSPQEKTLLNRLSVFTGGWTLDAANAVCASGEIEEWDVVDGLTSLIDKSLVTAVSQESSLRYRLLESIRQYAGEKLGTDETEARDSHTRHRDFFLRIAEEAPKRLTGNRQARWLERLETEHDNLRAALDWSADRPEEIEVGLRLVAALPAFWELRGYFREGRQRCAALLQKADSVGPTVAKAMALAGTGMLAWWQGDCLEAQALYEQCLQIAEEIHNPAVLARALKGLGDAAFRQGQLPLAHDYYERSLELCRKLNDEVGTAENLTNLGNVVFAEQDYERALTCHKESLTLFQKLGDRRQEAMALGCIATIYRFQGNFETARRYYERNLTIQREVGDRVQIGAALHNLANCLKDQGDDWKTAQSLHQESLHIFAELGNRSLAAQTLELLTYYVQDKPVRMIFLYSAAQALRDALHTPLAIQERAIRDFLLAMACDIVGEDVFAETWQAGRNMSLEQVVAGAMEEPDEDEIPEMHVRNMLFVASTLENLAEQSHEDAAKTIRYYGAAHMLHNETGVPRSAERQGIIDAALAAARTVLGEGAFEPIWQEALALSADQAFSLALEGRMAQTQAEESPQAAEE